MRKSHEQEEAGGGGGGRSLCKDDWCTDWYTYIQVHRTPGTHAVVDESYYLVYRECTCIP